MELIYISKKTDKPWYCSIISFNLFKCDPFLKLVYVKRTKLKKCISSRMFSLEMKIDVRCSKTSVKNNVTSINIIFERLLYFQMNRKII